MNETPPNKNKKKKIIVAILLLLLLCLGGLGYYFSQQKEQSSGIKEDVSAVGYNSSLKKPKNFTKKQIALPGFSKIVVKEGAERTDVALFNPPFNEVYFEYKVIFDKTGETLLKTGAIAPGKAVKGFPLPKNLAPGEYSISFEIKTYDKKTKQKMNGGAGTTKLIVQKQTKQQTNKNK